jgi:DNA ligase (NAD+)
VSVHKAGGVIPEMLDIVATPQDTPFTIPECCPSCGSPLIREGEHLYCRNENACEDILIQRTAFLVSRDCLDIKGVGISTVVPLVVADMLIRKPIDILRICADKALFQDHATSQVNVAAVVRRAQWRLQQLRQRDPEALQRLYLGLSIPGLTKRTWQRIQADFLALPTASAQVDALGNKLWLQARGISKLTALQLTNAIQRRYDEMLDVATLHTVSK